MLSSKTGMRRWRRDIGGGGTFLFVYFFVHDVCFGTGFSVHTLTIYLILYCTPTQYTTDKISSFCSGEMYVE